ncbi:BTAD domain-containing putative transcriptional regulator [Mycobacterium sp. UM_Kg1]|uniref:BTAD domain-containing putative transcriptional regulator n=1 Tax=Mycobacterium sp. UM_Kg1 TaxID=1545691 RepID=UPI0006972245|nr:BTAD domain-containing putative transcriptional regulator [Mycobacterium sp. UM_Kg1]
MELGVLGPLQARRDGASVAIPGAKPRAILTMLGLRGGAVVPAETLIDLLWGQDPPRTAAKALQTHISALRRALGDGFVRTEGAGWVLDATEVDAPRYLLAAKSGRDAAAAGDANQAAAHFEEALSLWRGAPELPASRRGASERTRWTEGHAAMVEDRADALLATGRAAELIGELEAAVAEAPLRERRWAQLMLALYRAGRQGEALAAYQRARSLLADELGVDPGPELRRLAASVVAQDSALDHPANQQLPSMTRAVTFLLTDIEGSTAAWEADAGAMAIALARHDELVEQVVTSRGGRLIKTRGEGDATFSVFERPSGAAAAAVELQDAIAHEPWALREPMRIRIALHTGEVELRDGDYFGRAVNRAARLRSLAAGGQILCSGATAELVIDTLPDDVVLGDLGMRALRNLPRPEHVFELRPRTAHQQPEESIDEPLERPDLPAVLTGPGRFVGRGQELERLAAAWKTSLAGGIHAMLIAGEPGVGKTRVAGEWSRQAFEQGAVVLYGRSDEDLGAPYQPFSEALRSLVPCIGTHRLRGLRGVETLLALIPSLSELLPDLAAPPRADPDTERYALFDAVVALLELASAAAPVVLILDDLHWAAKPTLLLLRHLLRFGDHTRVQVVATYRSTDLDRSHPLAAMLADLHRDGTADRLSLGGLGADDVTAYIAEAGYDDEQLARALASVTGGNPFFLIEALRHVAESGGAWDPNTLPQGVREAVSRRLSHLSAGTNKALSAAAVVGSRFDVDLVERVVDQDLVDAFDEACRAGIVIEEPGGRYRFSHALIRQSLIAELASVRRMRLHQRIAETLETTRGADEELLGELAYHYFECAWAGNAAKAVAYCRRAADQAMSRLAYEAAADLYDRALHALDEVDDELPDLADQTADLLVARCEALLAAGEVTAAGDAVSQLQAATVNSDRLTAWATCFDGQLSMLMHPEKLDEIEAELGAAADRLAGLGDPAGEAKAHTVRAGCLARLGRIGDCEVALDKALTAARRAREQRRVNAVLAGAPLAALWGPSPVPRAGGRCLDVVRLLRITTDSPAVEATSTRCQAVLEAFRGRAATALRMIEAARRTVAEVGLRHALLEVEQFAGIIELVLDDPEGAEPRLRQAYAGFRRMRMDADTAETAALLGRACMALGRDAEAEQLCTESESLAGHALKASIAWRTLRALLLTRRGDHAAARQMAESAVDLAQRTDALIDHGDACLALATVLHAAGDAAGARAAAQRATELYERKGAEALAAKARAVLGERVAPAPVAASEDVDGAIAELEARHAESEKARPRPPLGNSASTVAKRWQERFAARDWAAMTAMAADDICTDDRRRVMGAGVRRGRDVAIADMRVLADLDTTMMSAVVATRGERLALCLDRLSEHEYRPDAFHGEILSVIEIDTDGRLAAGVIFDVDDFDAALAELDARYLAGEAAAFARTWSAITGAFVALSRGEMPTPAAGFTDVDHRTIATVRSGDLMAYLRVALEDTARNFIYVEAVHRLTERGAVITHVAKGTSRDGLGVEWRLVNTVLVDGELISRLEMFEEADLDAALASFDELSRNRPTLENAATRTCVRAADAFNRRDGDAIFALADDDGHYEDRRKGLRSVLEGPERRKLIDATLETVPSTWRLGVEPIAVRGSRLSLTRDCYRDGDDPERTVVVELLRLTQVDATGLIRVTVSFDVDDIDAALAELDARYLAGDAAAYAHTWSLVTDAYAGFNRREAFPTTPDWISIDHRRGAGFESGDMLAYIEAAWADSPDTTIYIAAVHRLSPIGAVVTHVAHGISQDGFAAEWRDIVVMTVDGHLFNRSELFDGDDLDAALARFDEL